MKKGLVFSRWIWYYKERQFPARDKARNKRPPSAFGTQEEEFRYADNPV